MQYKEVRLIDANALKRNIEREIKVCHELFELGDKEAFKKYHGLKRSLELLESAPTVETTDDMWARLPKNFRYTFETKSDTYEVWTRDSDSEHTLKLGYGNTPVEALKKLEESLNRK